MSEAATRVTVVGAGGIGCALGHALLSGGVEVTLIEVDATKLEWGSKNGVAVDDKPAHPAKFVPFDRWSPSHEELVLLCTKCYDNSVVLERVQNSVELIPVQNGYDAALVDRVEVEGIASFVTECIPGKTHTRITRPGDLHIGFSVMADGRSLPARIEMLVEALEQHGSFTVLRVPEILPYKNTKLLYNAAISPIAAIAGLDNGQLLTIANARRLFFGLLRENYRILKGTRAPLERIGPFHPDTVNRLLHLPVVARLLAIPFSRSLRGTYCSMAGDLPNGPTELDNYNGYLLELAGDIDVPLNREVYSLAKRVEEEGHAPGLRWLDELLASTSV
ncbi:MAG: ketopantoate reductase family protein [Anaerolineales bacterium]|nr:ketopantoate reductase family protein [Anaerolineales bacterium]